MGVLLRIHTLVWGIPLVSAILIVGLRLTISTRAVQIRLFPKAATCLHHSIAHKSDDYGAFQGLCTALGATVGTGNIVGVAGALCMGGPGAIFWMWLGAFLGMATKYAEALLSHHYARTDKEGRRFGGMPEVIADGMGRKWIPLAKTYAFLGLIAAFGVGNATQVNTMVAGLQSMFGLDDAWRWAWGAALAVLILFLLSGGLPRIGRATEKLVPLGALGYITLSSAVLLLRAEAVIPAVKSIFIGAWNPAAITGGAIPSVWICARMGICRGVFSNEAGMGTAGFAHGASRSQDSCEQGMMGILEVFTDTFLICTLTALVILVSGVEIPCGVDKGTLLTMQALTAVLGPWSGKALSMLLFLFSLATVIGWGYYGMRCADFLFGQQRGKRYMILQGITVILGAGIGSGLVWLMADTVNGIMAVPNLICLWKLTGKVRNLTKKEPHTES